MLHYNFPPFSVGECGRMGGAGRREIGHGQSGPSFGLRPCCLPLTCSRTPSVWSRKSPRSNGSTSMASGLRCFPGPDGRWRSDEGRPVAGIAMGLVQEGEKFAVLTDILGDEDHLGDMDFKVAGTAEGVTALQMDIKINGITARHHGVSSGPGPGAAA